ncbi:MAG: LytTR family transcriptional regulator DNA-binding domain-containing protein [Clostridia bacterium]|nr:LytTR family transcriptional regulator DNA-binding domain-containing protein [Clostridia bacterium]
MYEKRILLKNEKDICFFQAETGRVFSIINKASSFENRHSLSYLEKHLSDRFFRCHKNYLINLDKVLEVTPWFNSTLMLKLESWEGTVPVSRKYIKEFKQIIGW